MGSLKPQPVSLPSAKFNSILMPQPPARTQLPAGSAAQPESTGLPDSRVSQGRGGHAIFRDAGGGTRHLFKGHWKPNLFH